MVDLVPIGNGKDDAPQINAALTDGVTLNLNGDFVIFHTVYIPSNVQWTLNGSLKLGDKNVNLSDASDGHPTGITEKSGGATNIKMSGGTYDGNKGKLQSKNPGIRFIDFIDVQSSTFSDMIVKNSTDDNFTLGSNSSNNECRNIIGDSAYGNALTDRGNGNKWFDCTAQNCRSDGWTPKCVNSEFHNCIAINNGGPGFGMFARVDVGGGGATISGNKWFNCDAHDNSHAGFSFNIASTSGSGAKIENNFIQAVCYNNGYDGVHFTNKQPDGIIKNNEIDILVYNNNKGGLGLQADKTIKNGVKGNIVAYGNKPNDIDLGKSTGNTIIVYHPKDKPNPVINKGTGNTVTVIDFSCPASTIQAYCVSKYCGNVPPKNKFDVKISGPSNMKTMIVTKNANGAYTSDEACQLTCSAIKDMDT